MKSNGCYPIYLPAGKVLKPGRVINLLLCLIITTATCLITSAQEGVTYTKHTIQKGETLYRIAVNNGLKLAELLQANPEVGSGNDYKVGQVLIIPIAGKSTGGIANPAPVKPAPVEPAQKPIPQPKPEQTKIEPPKPEKAVAEPPVEEQPKPAIEEKAPVKEETVAIEEDVIEKPKERKVPKAEPAPESYLEPQKPEPQENGTPSGLEINAEGEIIYTQTIFDNVVTNGFEKEADVLGVTEEDLKLATTEFIAETLITANGGNTTIEVVLDDCEGDTTNLVEYEEIN